MGRDGPVGSSSFGGALAVNMMTLQEPMNTGEGIGTMRRAGGSLQMRAQERVGPYVLTRALQDGFGTSRWLCLHAERQTSHLLHMFIQNHSSANFASADRRDAWQRLVTDRSTFEKRIGAMAHKRVAHVLSIEDFGWHPQAGGYAITDYTGDADGVVTLAGLLALKGGRMTLEEARRSCEQLFEASQQAHDMGMCHGPVTMDQVHVDRRGSLWIEFYGLEQSLAPSDDAVSLELRSIVRICYQLATGLLPIEPVIPVEDVIRPIERSWCDFFETGLGVPGFTTAPHALSAVRSTMPGNQAQRAIGGVKRFFRRIAGG
jgi:hypothetical protein